MPNRHEALQADSNGNLHSSTTFKKFLFSQPNHTKQSARRASQAETSGDSHWHRLSHVHILRHGTGLMPHLRSWVRTLTLRAASHTNRVERWIFKHFATATMISLYMTFRHEAVVVGPKEPRLVVLHRRKFALASRSGASSVSKNLARSLPGPKRQRLLSTLLNPRAHHARVDRSNGLVIARLPQHTRACRNTMHFESVVVSRMLSCVEAIPRARVRRTWVLVSKRRDTRSARTGSATIHFWRNKQSGPRMYRCEAGDLREEQNHVWDVDRAGGVRMGTEVGPRQVNAPAPPSAAPPPPWSPRTPPGRWPRDPAGPAQHTHNHNGSGAAGRKRTRLHRAAGRRRNPPELVVAKPKPPGPQTFVGYNQELGRLKEAGATGQLHDKEKSIMGRPAIDSTPNWCCAWVTSVECACVFGTRTGRTIISAQLDQSVVHHAHVPAEWIGCLMQHTGYLTSRLVWQHGISSSTSIAWGMGRIFVHTNSPDRFLMCGSSQPTKCLSLDKNR